METISDPAKHCEFCYSTGGVLLWKNALCRIVFVDDANYPGFCRVILNRHVREMTDLDSPEQSELMRIVLTTELVLRRLMQPDKINLASLGNVTPHLHWHVIPRWREDTNFPNPIWGATQRDVHVVPSPPSLDILRSAFSEALGTMLLIS